MAAAAVASPVKALEYVSCSGQLFELQEHDIVQHCKEHHIERVNNFRRIAESNDRYMYVSEWQGLWHVRWLQRVDKLLQPIPGEDLVPVLGEPLHFLRHAAPESMKKDMSGKKAHLTLGSYLKGGYYPTGKGNPPASNYKLWRKVSLSLDQSRDELKRRWSKLDGGGPSTAAPTAAPM